MNDDSTQRRNEGGSMTNQKDAALEQAARELDAACKMYCQWFDHGQPPIDGGAMAYELVTAIRHALARINGARQRLEQAGGLRMVPEYKSSILRCYDEDDEDDDCPVCRFIGDGRDEADMLRVIEVLDALLADSEGYTRKLEKLLVEQ